MWVVLAAGFAPRPVSACTCDASRAIPAFPRDGALNVPLDALLWTSAVGLWEIDRVWVVDDDAPTVPVEGAWREIALDLPSTRTFRPTGAWKA